jgi:hypothetical protein
MAVHEVSRIEHVVRRCLHGRGDPVVWRKGTGEHNPVGGRTDGCEVTDPVSSKHQEDYSADRSEAAFLHVRATPNADIGEVSDGGGHYAAKLANRGRPPPFARLLAHVLCIN